jgi:Fe-S-cluster containining protein
MWECTRCAKCCKIMSVPIRELAPGQVEFVKAKGFEIRSTDQGWFLYWHGVCPHLHDENICDIYETRPELCKKYTCEEVN